MTAKENAAQLWIAKCMLEPLMPILLSIDSEHEIASVSLLAALLDALRSDMKALMEERKESE